MEHPAPSTLRRAPCTEHPVLRTARCAPSANLRAPCAARRAARSAPRTEHPPPLRAPLAAHLAPTTLHATHRALPALLPAPAPPAATERRPPLSPAGRRHGGGDTHRAGAGAADGTRSPHPPGYPPPLHSPGPPPPAASGARRGDVTRTRGRDPRCRPTAHAPRRRRAAPGAGGRCGGEERGGGKGSRVCPHRVGAGGTCVCVCPGHACAPRASRCRDTAVAAQPCPLPGRGSSGAGPPAPAAVTPGPQQPLGYRWTGSTAITAVGSLISTTGAPGNATEGASRGGTGGGKGGKRLGGDGTAAEGKKTSLKVNWSLIDCNYCC